HLAGPADPDASLVDLRERYRGERAAAVEHFRSQLDPDALTRRLTRATDRALRGLWRIHAPGRDATLVALGGHGRGEQFPHSDVDLMMLTAGTPDEAQVARIEAFIGACWDFGLSIGHSVRTIEQCLAESRADVTVQTSLLELRWIAGSRARCAEL